MRGLDATPLTDGEVIELARAQCPHLSQPEPTPDSHFAAGEAWHLGARELHAWAYDGLVAGLGRLNELSRDHPIWTDTNGRPTASTLYRFLEWTLTRNPDDLEALRATCALAVIHCPRDFAAQAWRKLWRSGELPASLALSAALWCELNSGSGLRDALTTETGFREQNAEQIARLRTARFDQIRRFAHDLVGHGAA